MNLPRNGSPADPIGRVTDLQPMPLSEQVQLTGDVDVIVQQLPGGKELRVLSIATMGGQRLYLYVLDVIGANALARKLMRGERVTPAEGADLRGPKGDRS
jgi:hypothetical protein